MRKVKNETRILQNSHQIFVTVLSCPSGYKKSQLQCASKIHAYISSNISENLLSYRVFFSSHEKKVFYSPCINRHKRNVQKFNVIENKHPKFSRPRRTVWVDQQVKVAVSVHARDHACQEGSHSALDPLPEGLPVSGRDKTAQVRRTTDHTGMPKSFSHFVPSWQ